MNILKIAINKFIDVSVHGDRWVVITAIITVGGVAIAYWAFN